MQTFRLIALDLSNSDGSISVVDIMEVDAPLSAARAARRKLGRAFDRAHAFADDLANIVLQIDVLPLEQVHG